MTKRTLTPQGRILLQLADHLAHLTVLQAQVCEPFDDPDDEGWVKMFAPQEDVDRIAHGISEAARICRALADEPLTEAEDEV